MLYVAYFLPFSASEVCFTAIFILYIMLLLNKSLSKKKKTKEMRFNTKMRQNKVLLKLKIYIFAGCNDKVHGLAI